MNLSPCLNELREEWLPHVTDAGLERIIDLLEKSSPLLIHGAFTRAVPMGCLATQIAWNHPRTCHLTLDAGCQERKGLHQPQNVGIGSKVAG